MTDLESQLIDRGLSAEDVTYVVDLIENRSAEFARSQAARLLHVIFLRVERDSAAGCALRRGLGFSSDASLARAARDFCVSKQYLHDLQLKLEAQLGELSFLAKGAREDDAGRGVTGPSGHGRAHR